MNLPSKSTIYKNEMRNEDDRGGILSIVDTKIENVSIINCTPGSIRSNHYHHEDFHFMYVLEGDFDYFFKDIDSEEVGYLRLKLAIQYLPRQKKFMLATFPQQPSLL